VKITRISVENLKAIECWGLAKTIDKNHRANALLIEEEGCWWCFET